MIPNCLDYARRAKDAGRPIVGIMCEYTPREILMAAGAVPVCLCGGSAGTIPAAESDLPTNLCPLIKSTYGYHVTGKNPFLEMADLLVAETTCDGKKKMYELLSRTRPMHVLELPQKPDHPAARQHWLAELRGLVSVLKDRFGVAITDDRLRDSIRAMNRERSLRRRIGALMAADAPPLTGRQVLDLKSSISCIEEDLAQYETILAALEGTSGPAERAARVRVVLTGVPLPHGAERVMDIVEANGGLVVAADNCTGLKPIEEDIDADADNPLEAIADKYLHLPCSVMTPNDGRLALLGRLAAAYRPQCVVELVWQACLTYDIEATRVRAFVDQTLGLPYLRIGTDYSPSDSSRIAVRVEALFETVRGSRRP
ncbi:MAG: 2-hydroxyacyl-CoA dehydratase [Planctomycetes bacterium]|nr:2-hydroxyacyl-CoA dehydratase [Planctomycetota bacterium]